MTPSTRTLTRVGILALWLGSVLAFAGAPVAAAQAEGTGGTSQVILRSTRVALNPVAVVGNLGTLHAKKSSRSSHILATFTLAVLPPQPPGLNFNHESEFRPETSGALGGHLVRAPPVYSF